MQNDFVFYAKVRHPKQFLVFKLRAGNVWNTHCQVWILMNFVLVSVILSEWRDRQRSHRCLICPRWVPASSFNRLCRGAAIWRWPPLTSPRCRTRRWWTKRAPTRRTTMPRTRRSWPPPPATSGPPCRTWTQSWTPTSKTFRSRATSRPSWTRTVFPRRLRVRLHPPPEFVLASSSRLVTSMLEFPKRDSNSWGKRICSLSKNIDFTCGACITVLFQFPTALWPREQLPLRSGGMEKKPPHLGHTPTSKHSHTHRASASDPVSPPVWKHFHS